MKRPLRAKKRTAKTRRVVLTIKDLKDPSAPIGLYEVRALRLTSGSLLRRLSQGCLVQARSGKQETNGASPGSNGNVSRNSHSGSSKRPYYDTENRRLFCCGQVVKRFRVPAPNQHLILSAAQELRWLKWFDDPLPRGNCRNPKVRLHDTIKALNGNQAPYLIHFKGDGTGTRVGWELR